MNFSKFILSALILTGFSATILEAGRYRYADTSYKTGRLTTNYVNPYYKCDGTFVDGYWRS